MKWFTAKKKVEEQEKAANTMSTGGASEDHLASVAKEQEDKFGRFSDFGGGTKKGESVEDRTDLTNIQSNLADKEQVIDKKNPWMTSGEELVSDNEAKHQSVSQTDKILTEDKEVRKLIELILSSKKDSITPSVNFEENQWSYPLLEQIGSPEHVAALLEELSSPSVNILEKGEYERLPVCPKHPQYFATSVRLYCSACFSSNVVKLHLIEHSACGYITTKMGFGEVSADINKCASCKKTIKEPEKELRKVGRWYQCNNCKIRFDDLVIRLHCREFKHDFDINQADIAVIPFYKLKADSKSVSIYAFSLIPQFKKMSVFDGFAVEGSSAVKGKSGVMHKASIYAYNRENKTVIIDIKSAESEIGDAEVNSMLVKVLDISPSVAILIAVPSVSETAKALAAAHNISVVTGKDFAEILGAVEQILKTRLYLENKLDKNVE